jgi:enoyl-CoA hydratase
MNTIEYTDLIVEKKSPIGYITINRPEKRNSLTTFKGGTVQQLGQAALDMRDDPEIRVFIVKGAGDCFCSGFDLSSYDDAMWKEQESLPEAVKWVDAVKDEPWARYGRVRGDLSNPEGQPLVPSADLFFDEYWNNPTPSIAVVSSYCLGAGLWLANNCDVVYATPNAVFAYPPIRYGASVQLCILPPWLMGRRMNLWMALTGQYITADEAFNSNLITKLIPEEKLEEEANKLATSIARVPPATNMFSKRAINNYFEGLGIQQAKRLGNAFVRITENSMVPGHYMDFFDKVRKHGLREGLKRQRENFGTPDPVMEKEMKRLKAKKD